MGAIGNRPGLCNQSHYILDSGGELCLCQLVQLFPRHGFQLPIAETNILSCKERRYTLNMSGFYNPSNAICVF